MAVRNGKQGSVEARKGGASPRNVLFRTAGFATVWQWGDEEPGVLSFAGRADCRFSIWTARSADSDTGLAVTNLRFSFVDLAFTLVRPVDAYFDEEIAVEEESNLTVDVDQGIVVLNAVDRCFDGQAVVSVTADVSCDTRTVVTRSLLWESDISLLVSWIVEALCDALLDVIDPELLAADMQLIATAVLVGNRDVSLLVSGYLDRTADAGFVVSGLAQQSADALISVGRSVGILTDASSAVTNALAMDRDVAQMVLGRLDTMADAGVQVLSRMTPDTDSAITVYALLIRESHVIQT